MSASDNEPTEEQLSTYVQEVERITSLLLEPLASILDEIEKGSPLPPKVFTACALNALVLLGAGAVTHRSGTKQQALTILKMCVGQVADPEFSFDPSGHSDE